MATTVERLSVRIPAGTVALDGDLEVPPDARGIVLFAHGSGSGRHSPRNRSVARALQEAGLATLLFDLLTRAEEAGDLHHERNRFDIETLAARLVAATDWIAGERSTRGLRVGYFGASTGAAAALMAAAELGEAVGAVVSRGGRPELAGEALLRVHTPTLLIVGGEDTPVLRVNEEALALLPGPRQLEVVPGASHLFGEPGALDTVTALARDWFTRHLHDPTAG
jgi:putative phosphoribosyl transferase